MKRSILAKFLVLCMILSMMAVPAMATDLSGIDGSDKFAVGNEYTVSNGAYSISLSGGHTGSVTLNSGDSLSLSRGDYTGLTINMAPGSTLSVASSAVVGTINSTDSDYVVVQNESGTYTVEKASSVAPSTQPTLPAPTGTPTDTTTPGTTEPTTEPTEPTEPTPVATEATTVEVEVQTTVEGDTVTVEAPTEEAITAAVEAAEGETAIVSFDLKEAGEDVTTATLPTAVMETVAGMDNVAGITLEMPQGDVTLDDTALAAIAEVAGDTVSVTLETSADTASLAEAQQESLDGLTTGATVSISVVSGDVTISDFGGGTVKLTVPFVPAEGTSAENYAGYYVDDEGGLTAVPSAFTGDSWTLDITHNSDYVAIYEPYGDVKATYWGFKAVQYAFDKKIMTGMTETTFEPETKLSRAMMVTMLFRLNGASAGAAGQFTDVKANDWFADAVNWAASAKVASGMGDGTFAPNATMTREQMAQFLYNYAKANGVDVSKTTGLDKFSDSAKVSDWATAAMQWAVAEGYISGMEDGTLNPQGTATRAQVATVFMRYMQANG